MALPTVTISGSVLSPAGAAPTSGTISVRLSAPGTAKDASTGADQVVTGQVTWTLSSGALPGGCVLVPSASITPVGGAAGDSRYFAVYTVVVGGVTERWEETWYVPAAPATQELGDLAANALALQGVQSRPEFLAVLPEGMGGTGASSLTTAGIVRVGEDIGGTATAPQVVATHLTDPLPEAQGGTGAATVAAATVPSVFGVTTNGYVARKAAGTDAWEEAALPVGVTDLSGVVAGRLYVGSGPPGAGGASGDVYIDASVGATDILYVKSGASWAARLSVAL